MYRPERFGRTAAGERGSHDGEMSRPLSARDPLIPAKAGIQKRNARRCRKLGPAFARTSRRQCSLPRRIALRLLSRLLSALGAGACWIVALGPAPLGEELTFSTRVRRSRRPAAAGLRQPGGPLAASRARAPTSIRASSICCSPMRINGFRAHHGVDPLALLRARHCSSSAADGSGPAVRP